MLGSAPAIELTDDPRFARRVIRLALTSLVALGVIWLFGTRTLPVSPIVGLSLGAGWLLMPSLLGLSLRWPRIRYALVLPASLVSLALIAICLSTLPARPLARTGWVLTTVGILLGSFLGGWFWFRGLPVPSRLHDPFSTGRWALIAVHVTLIVSGLGLVGVSVLNWL